MITTSGLSFFFLISFDTLHFQFAGDNGVEDTCLDFITHVLLLLIMYLTGYKVTFTA